MSFLTHFKIFFKFSLTLYSIVHTVLYCKRWKHFKGKLHFYCAIHCLYTRTYRYWKTVTSSKSWKSEVKQSLDQKITVTYMKVTIITGFFSFAISNFLGGRTQGLFRWGYCEKKALLRTKTYSSLTVRDRSTRFDFELAFFGGAGRSETTWIFSLTRSTLAVPDHVVQTPDFFPLMSLTRWALQTPLVQDESQTPPRQALTRGP
jgi:hypothetical protein